MQWCQSSSVDRRSRGRDSILTLQYFELKKIILARRFSNSCGNVCLLRYELLKTFCDRISDRRNVIFNYFQNVIFKGVAKFFLICRIF